MSSLATGAGARRDPNHPAVQPRIEPGRWMHEPDYWKKEAMIAMTGHYPVPRPTPRPLPPPQRFRPPVRWKSVMVLGVFMAVTVLACVGIVQFGKLSINVLTPLMTPLVTPTVQPTPTPTIKPKTSPTTPAHK